MPSSSRKPRPRLSRRPFRAGGHNLHDEAGTPTFFATVLFFTEAVPQRILTALGRLGRLRRRVIWSTHDTSMVLVLSRWLWVPVGLPEYHLAHHGIAEVTPHRGTLVQIARRRLTRRTYAFILSHRINRPPWIGAAERELRTSLWNTHTALDCQLAQDLRRPHTVVAGGDYNVDGYGAAWRGVLSERGQHPDRAASDSSRATLGQLHWLSREGSDHPRWWVDAFPY